MKHWQEFTYSASDGLRLAGRRYGWENRGSVPVVCLSGLSRNSRDFHELAMHLSTEAGTRRRVLTLDYRGRGRSQYDPNWQNYNLVVEADDVIQGLVAAGLQHAHFIGTSRGGLICMLLAGMRPGIMHSVILNDVGPEIAGAGLVRIKKSLEAEHTARDWADAAEQLKRAGERDFPNRSQSGWERHARMIYRENGNAHAGGKPGLVRDFDPKLGKTLAEIDLDSPLPTMWAQFAGLAKHPLMLIRGKNTDLLDETAVQKMAGMHPAMERMEIPDAGHVPDLGERPLAERIAAFLEANDTP